MPPTAGLRLRAAGGARRGAAGAWRAAGGWRRPWAALRSLRSPHRGSRGRVARCCLPRSVPRPPGGVGTVRRRRAEPRAAPPERRLPLRAVQRQRQAGKCPRSPFPGPFSPSSGAGGSARADGGSAGGSSAGGRRLRGERSGGERGKKGGEGRKEGGGCPPRAVTQL